MKIRRPNEAPSGTRRVPLAYDKQREAAIEKVKAKYIPLECGHMTDWETDELYSVWRPHRNKHYCETCGTWQFRLHKRRETVLPDQPLF